MQTSIKTGPQFRALTLARSDVNADTRTVSLSFASEAAEVERYFGLEVLSHDPAHVRLGRMQDGAALLLDHNQSRQIGVVESVEIGSDRKSRALVRFGKSALAEEAFSDVVDGIKRHVSVGYIVHRYALLRAGKDGSPDVYIAVDWEPFEISLVAVPADAGVGIGRAAPADALDVPVDVPALSPDPVTPDAAVRLAELAGEVVDPGTSPAPAPELVAPAPVAAVRSLPNPSPIQSQRKDMNPTQIILALAAKFRHLGADEIARDYLASNAEPDAAAFQALLLDKVGTKATDTTRAQIGLSPKEVKRFSMLRAINSLASPQDKAARNAAAFEMEASEAVAKLVGRAAQGFFLPQEILERDLTVTANSGNNGGKLVETTVLGGSFIDSLKARMMTQRMGAQLLSGLVGNIAIPRHTGGVAAYWVAESGAPTESTATFDQVTMSPKTVGAFSDISRKLLLQSSIGVEAWVMNELATRVALAVDMAGINGAGASNEPTGILQTAGIGSVVGGTNGAAPTWAHIVELWSDVAIANADFGSTGFLTNAKVAGKLMTTEKAANTAQFVCPAFPGADGMTTFGGGRAGISNQVPSTLDKGTATDICSAIIYGNWADLIYGLWGATDVVVDPFTGSTSGTVRVVVLNDVDVAVRHAESFSAMLDALTA